MFYQLMGRLEERGYVEGTYQQRIIAGQGLRARLDEVTGADHRAPDEAVYFYGELRKQAATWTGEPAK